MDKSVLCVFSKFFDPERHNLNSRKLNHAGGKDILSKNLGMTIVTLQWSVPNTQAME